MQAQQPTTKEDTSAGPPVNGEKPHRRLGLEYEQINENIRFLADVRFKLLAIVPTLGGVAIFILSQRIGLQSGEAPTTSRLDWIAAAAFAVLGFLATLGLTLYDQRNSELYNALIHRAKYLENDFNALSVPGSIRRADDNQGRLQRGGQYTERPRKHRRIIFEAGHDMGLALIYGPLLGAWFLPISYSAIRLLNFTYPPDLAHQYARAGSTGVALLAAAIFFSRLVRLDKNENELYRTYAKADGLIPKERKMTETIPDSFKTYEDGKHRRYQLLFAVNGGAFAVVKLLVDKEYASGTVLGGLSLRQLATGMVLFTAIMVVDIFMFGEKMRKYIPNLVFGWQGKLVLILLGIIMCAGWILVAR